MAFQNKMMRDMSWPEISKLAKYTNTVIISVGSFEQHGTHMPMCCDTIQAEAMALDVAGLLDERGVTIAVGPSIHYGVNPAAMPFAGSVTLTPDTLKRLIIEICGSMKAHGFNQVALIMGHDENIPAMLMAAQELTYYHEMKVIALNWLPYLKLFEKAKLSEAGSVIADGHGGAGETSRMMARFPYLVDLTVAQSYVVQIEKPSEELAYAGPPLLGGGVYNPSRDLPGFAPPSHPGIVGNPKLADADNGEKAYAVCAEWIAKVILREFYPNKKF